MYIPPTHSHIHIRRPIFNKHSFEFRRALDIQIKDKTSISKILALTNGNPVMEIKSMNCEFIAIFTYHIVTPSTFEN